MRNCADPEHAGDNEANQSGHETHDEGTDRVSTVADRSRFLAHGDRLCGLALPLSSGQLVDEGERRQAAPVDSPFVDDARRASRRPLAVELDGVKNVEGTGA